MCVRQLIEKFNGLDDICEIEDLWKPFKEGTVKVATEVCDVCIQKQKRM